MRCMLFALAFHHLWLVVSCDSRSGMRSSTTVCTTSHQVVWVHPARSTLRRSTPSNTQGHLSESNLSQTSLPVLSCVSTSCSYHVQITCSNMCTFNFPHFRKLSKRAKPQNLHLADGFVRTTHSPGIWNRALSCVYMYVSSLLQASCTAYLRVPRGYVQR